MAKAEFDDAADWYNQQRAGLGDDFIAEVESVLDEIATNPDRYPQVHQDVREAPVHRFPYCVYYREETARIVIIAVYHNSRDPSVWQARI